MERPSIKNYEYSNKAVYVMDLNKFIDYLESQNKELIEEIKVIHEELRKWQKSHNKLIEFSNQPSMDGHTKKCIDNI